MVILNYCQASASHISELIYSLSHRQQAHILAVCPGQKNKQFYTSVNFNTNYRNVTPLTLQQYLSKSTHQGATAVLILPPPTFEELQKILNKSNEQKQTIILALLKQNKKYLNMISKKISGLELKQVTYSKNKFVGINDKIRDLVDQSYDMNRAGFYAYGEFINVYRANMLKKIFRTQLLKVDDLARSYGFTSAQRVKEGNFLKTEAQKQQARQAKIEKRKKKIQAALDNLNKVKEGQQMEEENEVVQQVKPSVNKAKKIKKLPIKPAKKSKPRR